MGLKKLRANKKATKGTAKAWKKGQSSSYNPQCKKFRDEAKRRVKFGCQNPNSKLTEIAVIQHNKEEINKLDNMDDCDATSVGGLSFVSTFSNCTNPTFNRLLTRWHSNSALHKEMLAVLAAVTEVIKAKGGKETETEYFAALMTTLDVVDNDEGRTAVLSLLYMVVKRLPDTVLKLHFSNTCTVLKDLLLKYINSDFNALLRNLVGCLFCFLKSQTSSKWTASVKETFQVLLEFTVHYKPKVRKSAQQAIAYLVSAVEKQDTDEQTSSHPAAALTGQFCVQKIENASGSDGATTSHVLNLLKDVMARLSMSCLKLCCETVLRLMTLSNSIMTTNCLKTLQGLFTQNPSPENLPHELNVRIIKALYDYQPSFNDGELFIDWLLVMEYAFVNLYRLNPSACVSHLPRFYKTTVLAWNSERENLHAIISSTLKTVLRSCINPSSSEFQQFMMENPIDNPMHKMFHAVEDALSYKFHKSWGQVLTVLEAFFDVMGKYSYTVMLKCLQSMANLRDSFKFLHIFELDKAIGAAIRRMGPETVLKAIPLEIDIKSDKTDFPRSWMLPLLRDNIQETELAFFVQYFLPLASQLRQKGKQCESEKRSVQAKMYELICSQIWSLLPGFCTSPTDLLQSWKSVAKVLGVSLNEQPLLRTTILSSLRMLISKNLENEENKAEIAAYAKNYLPILFNLYTTESKGKAEEGTRLATFDTIRVFLQITDSALCQSFFEKSMEKLKDATDFSQCALLDLAKSMLSCISEDHIKALYDYCKPHLNSTQHTVQKKSYGVISELCGCQSEVCLSFVSNNLEDLKSLLLTSLSSSSPPSKALRLNCLRNIVHHLSEDNKEFVVAIVPEATLCTKETAVKARTNAYHLLAEIGDTLKRWKPDDEKEAVRDFLQMLLAGFSGGPHMMSATILAIGHVIYAFKDHLDSDLIHLLIENTCLLLTSRSREVVTSALSFVKILFSSVSTEDLAQHVEFLVKSIGSISGDHQRAFRFKAKELFTRLVRKFGFEMISKLAPEQFKKQLNNIRKLESRKDKSRSSNSMEYELEKFPKHKSDMIDDVLCDSDEEQSNMQKEKTVKKRKMWIEECENEIVDFMDPSANRKILASKPAEETQVKTSSGFEISSDGRLIIPDDKEESKHVKKKSDDHDDDVKVDYCKGKKRKHGDSSDEEDKPKPKPVLKGIHRVLGKTPKFGAAFSSKKAAGDMKKGKLDPYAYIPLNSQVLNKRKQSKLQGQFKGLVRAAKKGAQKGAKKGAKIKLSKKPMKKK